MRRGGRFPGLPRGIETTGRKRAPKGRSVRAGVSRSVLSGAYVDFYGGAWYGPDAQDFQGVAGCRLFAFFDGAAGARGYFFALHGDPGGEAWPVGWALFGDYAVDGSEAVGL